MLQCTDRDSKKDELKTQQSYTGSFIVKNAKGLHTRPSTELVKCSSRFSASINLTCGEVTVNAKSILGILMLAASKGTKLTLDAEGVDAKEAIETLIKLANNKFYMNY